MSKSRRSVELLVLACLLMAAFASSAQAAECRNEALRETSPQLADCRAYELVPPAFLNGNGIEQTFDIEADGNAIVYGTLNAFGGAPSNIAGKWVARRTPDGWVTSSLNPPVLGRSPSAYDEPAVLAASSDLSQILLGSRYPFDPLDRSPYRSETESGNADVYRLTEGGATEWISHGPQLPDATILDRGFAGASSDLSRIFFATKEPLTLEAQGSAAANLYEWHDGTVRTVNVTTGGALIPGGAGTGRGNTPAASFESVGEFETGKTAQGEANDPSAVAADGKVVFFSAPVDTAVGPPEVYARVEGTRTVEASLCQVKACAGKGAPDGATFIDAAPDGSSVTFTSPDVLAKGATAGGSIYRYDVADGTLAYLAPIDLSAYPGGSGQQGGVLATSADGSYIYLCEGGGSLSVLHEGKVTPIAPLMCDAQASESEHDEEPSALRNGGALPQGGPHTTSEAGYAFVTTAGPDRRGQGERQVEEGAGEVKMGEERIAEGQVEEGEGLVTAGRETEALGRHKIAEAQAFPYPNQGHSEVYVYDAASGAVHCVSCRPGGAPAEAGAFLNRESRNAGGVTTGQSPVGAGVAVQNLTEDGARIFFVSEDALVPSDRNGLQDVYEWERPGSGTCATTSVSYNATDEGCVSLVSSGNDPRGATLQGVSANGNDVFIGTFQQLVPADTGTEQQIFDARVEGGIAAQHAVPAGPCGTEETCRGAGGASAPTGQVGSNRAFGTASRPARCVAASAHARRLAAGARRAGKKAHKLKGRAARRASARARRLRKQAAQAGKQARRCTAQGGKR